LYFLARFPYRAGVYGLLLDFDSGKEGQQALEGAGNTSTMNEYTFTDKNLANGKTYTYRLSDMSYNGRVHILKTVQATPGIQVNGSRLFNHYPNPFNPATHKSIR